MITNRLYIILGLCCLWLALPFCCMKVEAQNFVVVIDPGHGAPEPAQSPDFQARRVRRPTGTDP